MRASLIPKAALFGCVIAHAGLKVDAWAGAATAETEAESVDRVLEKLRQSTADLSSFQSQVQWAEQQPSLEAATVKTGRFYYKKTAQKSLLKVEFQTLRQDDLEAQKWIEQFIFDGTWLTIVDYQLEKVEKRQLAEEGQVEDVFAYANQYFPMLGFSQVEDLRKQFEIELVRDKQAPTSNAVQLQLKVKEGSAYSEDYVSIDFWIDRQHYLPSRIVAVTTEPALLEEGERDRLDIRFIKPKVNRRLSDRTFEAGAPKRFGEAQVYPLR